MTILTITALTICPSATADPPVVKTSSAFYSTRCADAWQAVRWYRARYNTHRATMGMSLAPPVEQGMDCRRLRERARYWQHAAKVNRAAAQRWLRLEYADPPEPLLSIAKCETGGINNGRPLWTHHNSTYAGAYGFRHSTWTQYRYPGYPRFASQATPRQQTRVAQRLVATFGGYSSWPACHRRLGLPG